MSEASTKKAIQEFLEIGHNQGKWFWLRLNSGKAWQRYSGNDKLYPIQLCEAGMPDLMVFMKWYPRSKTQFPIRLIFFEVKSEKGKLSDAQIERHKELKEYGAEVHTVKSLDEVIAILGGENGT